MKFLKSLKFLATILFLIITSGLIFHSPTRLYDLITGLETPEFSILWPGIRSFIEPIYSFSFYILTLNKLFYAPAIISWISWISCAVLIHSFLNKKTVAKSIHNVIYSLALFIALLSFVILIPVPGPKLLKPKGCISIDTHSHTISSHDGMSTAMISLKAHSWQGIDVFFNTEHNHTMGFTEFPESIRLKIVYPGMQIQTRSGISIVLLSLKKFDEQDYKNLSLADTVKKAHENNLFVIMPHWWKWHKYTFEELKNFGVDGFEIYNCGYRNFDKNEQKALINFARKNNLMMVGVTDWHGLGHMSDVWTIIEENLLENTGFYLQKKPLNTKVILYRKEQSGSFVRFIFEPFSLFYYYISNIDLKYLVSLVVWITVLFFIFRTSFFKYLKRFFALFMTTAYTCGIIYFIIITRSVVDINTVVMSSVVPAMVGMSVLWFILWKIGENKTL